MIPQIDTASVKVMRTFDYFHFEVSLTSTLANTTEAVDALRKEAARLADKAVAQYQTMKHAEYLRDLHKGAKWRLEAAIARPEGERTADDKAVIKYHQDAAFAAQFDYDYEDDWEEPEA